MGLVTFLPMPTSVMVILSWLNICSKSLWSDYGQGGRARAAVTLFCLFIYERCQFPPFPVRRKRRIRSGRARREYGSLSLSQGVSTFATFKQNIVQAEHYSMISAYMDWIEWWSIGFLWFFSMLIVLTWACHNLSSLGSSTLCHLRCHWQHFTYCSLSTWCLLHFHPGMSGNGKFCLE